MNKRIIHHGTPELIGVGNFDENKYIYDVCPCPLPYGYAIKIPWNDLTEHELKTGECHVHCDNCGTDSTICFRPRVNPDEIHKDIAKKIWAIAGISPEYGNAVMDVIGEEAYQNVMRLQSEENAESEE